MRHWLARVLDQRPLWSNLEALSLDVPELARTIRPGQFVLARDPRSFDPYLRRVLFPLAIHGGGLECAIDSADALARRVQPGDALDLRAPLGNALELNAQHILLAADAALAAPLVFLARVAVQLGRDVVFVARAAADAPAIQQSLPPEVEYHTRGAEEDGLTPEWIAWADAIFASAPLDSYNRLAEQISGARFRLTRGLAYALAHFPMPCGSGDCFACAVETTRGIALTCQAGPFFDLDDLIKKSAYD